MKQSRDPAWVFSIVLELAGLYGGGLTLGTAPLGGLRAELVLPGL
jgi:hypothetical protein